VRFRRLSGDVPAIEERSKAMRMKIINAVRTPARWILKILEVRVPMDAINGLSNR